LPFNRLPPLISEKLTGGGHPEGKWSLEFKSFHSIPRRGEVCRSLYHPSFDEGEIDSVCDELVSEGLVEVRSVAIKRGPTSSIKPWLKNRAREGKVKRPRCFLTVRGRRAAAAIRARLAAERHPRGPPRRENAGTSRPRRGIGVELWIDYPGSIHQVPDHIEPRSSSSFGPCSAERRC